MTDKRIMSREMKARKPTFEVTEIFDENGAPVTCGFRDCNEMPANVATGTLCAMHRDKVRLDFLSFKRFNTGTGFTRLPSMRRV